MSTVYSAKQRLQTWELIKLAQTDGELDNAAAVERCFGYIKCQQENGIKN